MKPKEINDRNLVDLSKIWHEASEMPVDNSRIVILYQYEIEGFNDVKMRDFPIHYFAHYDWARIVKRNFIKKWAYISDLLPKQLENCKQSKEVLL